MNNDVYISSLEELNKKSFLSTASQVRSLKALKSIVDSYYDGRITVTMFSGDFDALNHVYDLNVIMGMISSLVYEGLGLNIPVREAPNEQKEREV